MLKKDFNYKRHKNEINWKGITMYQLQSISMKILPLKFVMLLILFETVIKRKKKLVVFTGNALHIESKCCRK